MYAIKITESEETGVVEKDSLGARKALEATNCDKEDDEIMELSIPSRESETEQETAVSIDEVQVIMSPTMIRNEENSAEAERNFASENPSVPPADKSLKDTPLINEVIKDSGSDESEKNSKSSASVAAENESQSEIDIVGMDTVPSNGFSDGINVEARTNKAADVSTEGKRKENEALDSAIIIEENAAKTVSTDISPSSSAPVRRVARKSTRPPQNPQRTTESSMTEMLLLENPFFNEENPSPKRKLEISHSTRKVARKSTRPPVNPQRTVISEGVFTHRSDYSNQLDSSILLTTPEKRSTNGIEELEVLDELVVIG